MLSVIFAFSIVIIISVVEVLVVVISVVLRFILILHWSKSMTSLLTVSACKKKSDKKTLKPFALLALVKYYEF